MLFLQSPLLEGENAGGIGQPYDQVAVSEDGKGKMEALITGCKPCFRNIAEVLLYLEGHRKYKTRYLTLKSWPQQTIAHYHQIR